MIVNEWSSDWSSDYQEVNILKKCGVYDWIVNRLRAQSVGQGVVSVLDLGCGSGYLSSLLPDWSFSNVDPYPPRKCYGKVIESGVRQYLEGKSREYDVVLCLFSLHHFYYRGWLEEIERVLCRGGVCWVFGVDRGSRWFGDEGFNRLFFSRGFSSYPRELRLRMEREEVDLWGWIENKEMVEWLRRRGWSHLRKMTGEEIEGLVERVPRGRFRFHLRVEVYGLRV